MKEWYAIGTGKDDCGLIMLYFEEHNIGYVTKRIGRDEIHFEFYASPEEAEEFRTYMKGCLKMSIEKQDRSNKMDNNGDLKELMAGIGGICELAGLLRDELIRCGFTRKEAIYMVSNYTSKLLLPPTNRSGDD